MSYFDHISHVEEVAGLEQRISIHPPSRSPSVNIYIDMFALALPPALSHCVCVCICASFFLYLLDVSLHHWTQLVARSFTWPLGTTLLGHSSFCRFSLLLLLRAKRALQLSRGVSSSLLIPQVISFGSETLMFCLQPGLPPSSSSSCLYHMPKTEVLVSPSQTLLTQCLSISANGTFQLLCQTCSSYPQFFCLASHIQSISQPFGSAFKES